MGRFSFKGVQLMATTQQLENLGLVQGSLTMSRIMQLEPEFGNELSENSGELETAAYQAEQDRIAEAHEPAINRLLASVNRLVETYQQDALVAA